MPVCVSGGPLRVRSSSLDGPRKLSMDVSRLPSPVSDALHSVVWNLRCNRERRRAIPHGIAAIATSVSPCACIVAAQAVARYRPLDALLWVSSQIC
jgi:hypothetical protein